jgi:hypothetical protein
MAVHVFLTSDGNIFLHYDCTCISNF